MNRYVKAFLHRGLIFGGFGPIILGIVFLFIDLSGAALDLSGGEILLGIVSTYILAFVQSGASVFNQIEHWPIAKSTLCHFSLLFLVYSLTYVINAWIPFEPLMIVFFCLVFVLVYLTVWLTVFLSVRAHTKKLNANLPGQKHP